MEGPITIRQIITILRRELTPLAMLDFVNTSNWMCTVQNLSWTITVCPDRERGLVLIYAANSESMNQTIASLNLHDFIAQYCS